MRLKKFAVMSAPRCRHERQSAAGSNGYRRQIKCLACGKTLLEILLGTCQTDLLEKALAAATTDWQEFTTSAGKKYFYNTATKETSWEDPR